MDDLQVNREHKDRLFNFIFGREEHKDWTLSLYNAVNDSDYTDESLIRFNTLENILYLNMKNDTSFIIMNMLNVYEHQSSYNPNMPLRQLDYTNRLFSAYIKENKYNKYGSELIKLPVPKLVVFYDGKKEVEDEVILRLSDSYAEELKDKADVEVIVRMLNINFGHNMELMKKCRPLYEHAWFIDKIREYQNNGMTINEACDKVVIEMPKDYEIRGFIMKNIAEVKGILDTEYNEAEVMELFRNDGYKDGLKEGRLDGFKEGRLDGLKEGRLDGFKKGISALVSLVKDNTVSLEVAAKRAGVTEDEFKKMMDEYATNS